MTNAWDKITGGRDELGRAAWIPVYDAGAWRLFRNSHTIWPGVENVADPVRVENLRRNVTSLMEHYPETLPQLEKLGIRIKSLLNRPIRNHKDVVAWSESMFNVGPSTGAPIHVEDAAELAYDDFTIKVANGRHPQYVIPAAPRGSGNAATVDFNSPGAKTRFGPRHDYSKTAFQGSQKPSEAPSDPIRTTKELPAPQTGNGAVRPRGRPRRDGLVPGSPEAKAADAKKKAEARAAKRANQGATITELPVKQRRRLVRVGKSVAQSS